MGVAARRIERDERGRRDHLREVPKPARTKKPRAVPHGTARAGARVATRAQDARARAVFDSVMLLIVALTAVGLVRVAVLARAAEMTLTESTLAKRIKTQRIETDRLEVDRSSLATPSRIEQIAGATMQMGRPASVRYITMPLDGTAAGSGDEAASPADDTAAQDGVGGRSGAERVAAVLSTLAEMSAGEAQTLLVGDVGLAGSR